MDRETEQEVETFPAFRRGPGRDRMEREQDSQWRCNSIELSRALPRT